MIGAGLANPMLFAGGDPLDELGRIPRSVRIRASAMAQLTRPAQATAGAGWGLRCGFARVKRCRLGFGPQNIFGSTDRNDYFDRLSFDVNDKLVWGHRYANVDIYFTTNKAFRDPAAHTDIFWLYDSANENAANRVLLWADGELLPGSWIGLIAQNDAMRGFNPLSGVAIGGPDAASAGFWSDIIISQFGVIDGVRGAPSLVGQRHPKTGQWRSKTKDGIKAVVDAGDVNSVFLPFDDTTNLTTLCADASSKGNNFTATNVSLTAGATYDSMLDTPTNNFCTFNPALPINILTGGYYPIQPANGNLKITGSGAPPGNYQSGTQEIKHLAYFEGLVEGLGAGPTVGFGVINLATGAAYQYIQTGQKVMVGVASAYGAAFTTGDRIGILVDPTALTLEFFKQTGGVGAFVSQGVINSAFPSGTYAPFFYVSNGSSSSGNFGQQGFANTSVPVGAKAICTKNLPVRPPVMRSESAFVARADTGANIAATLAAVAPWSDWIRIYKRRDAAEGWRWQFSDDSASCLDSSSAAAKGAFPVLSGTSYVGYAIRVAASNGVATGQLAHVNGAADVVSDGLANSRKMVILVSETGSNWFVYHPDLTAGKLLYLNSTAGQTADATISGVTVAGFSLAQALPTGTYRWISIAEIAGFSKLGKFVGNGQFDGPVLQTEFLPMLEIVKPIGSTGGWECVDGARSPSNPVQQVLNLNLSDADTASYAQDFLAGSIKVRNTGFNGSGVDHVFLSFAAFPFRYANAR